MRTLLAFALAAAAPLVVPCAVPDAFAQRAIDAPTRLGSAPRLGDAPASAGARTGLRQYVARETFRMAQSVEFASGSAGGQGFGYGAYTNTVFWQPSQRLAARVDVGVAVPFGGMGGTAPSLASNFGGRAGQGLSPQVYLRNAEIAYRPSANAELRLSVQQVPSALMGPAYGYGGYGQSGFGSSAYGSMHSGLHTQARLGVGGDEMFWRPR